MATKITTRVLADNAVTDAKIADVTLTTATQSASDNTTKIATTAYVTTAIANLADSAPSTLNTLNELAAALGDDANYATTTTNAIAAKLPLAGGTMTGSITSVDGAEIRLGTDNDMGLFSSSGTSHIRINEGIFKLRADDMRFTAKNGTTERMRIDTDGRLAIANTTTAADSDIHDHVKLVVAGGAVVGTAAGADNSFLQYSDPGGLTVLQGSGTYGLRVFDDNSTTPRFTVMRSGNVGIGTSSPSAPLHITHGTPSIKFTDSSSSANYSMTLDGVTVNNTNSGTNGSIAFHTHNGEKLRLGATTSYFSNTNVGIGTTNTYSRKFVVEGTGDLMMLRSTNAGTGGAQLDLIHDSASYADGDSVGIVNFSTDDRQLTSIKGVGAASGERGIFHIGVRKSASEYNHNAMRLHNGGNEVLLDIYSPSGSNRGAGYFRFKTDGSGTEESVAQIYMEQGSGDGGSRKSAMYFQVADNGAPSTAMTIENNKFVSTASHLNVATSTAQSSSKLTVNGGIRFNHFSAGHGLNCVSLLSFNNSSVANACGSVYYKMFIVNLYHNNGHSQALFLANGGGGVGYRFTSINAGDNTIRNGVQDFSLTTIGSQPNTFRIQISNGGGAMTVSRTSGTGSFNVSVHVLAGG